MVYHDKKFNQMAPLTGRVLRQQFYQFIQTTTYSQQHNMKKTLLIALSLLVLPFVSHATVVVDWNASSTDQGTIQPNQVNGVYDAIKVPYVVATSTTASSTFANGINLTNGCYSKNGTCLTSNSGTVTGTGSTNTLTYWTSPSNTAATSSPTVGYITATSSSATSTFVGALKVGTRGEVIGDGTAYDPTVYGGTAALLTVSAASGNSGIELNSDDNSSYTPFLSFSTGGIDRWMWRMPPDANNSIVFQNVDTGDNALSFDVDTSAVSSIHNSLDDGAGNMSVGHALTINPTLDTGDVLHVNNFFGNNAFNVNTNNTSAGVVTTANNTLDDGNGNMIVNTGSYIQTTEVHSDDNDLLIHAQSSGTLNLQGDQGVNVSAVANEAFSSGGDMTWDIGGDGFLSSAGNIHLSGGGNIILESSSGGYVTLGGSNISNLFLNSANLSDANNSQGNVGDVLVSGGTGTNSGDFFQSISSVLTPAVVASSSVATSTASYRDRTSSIPSVNTYTPTASSTYTIAVTSEVDAISAGTLTITCTYTNSHGAAVTATFGSGLTTAVTPTLSPVVITPKINTPITVVATFTGVSVKYDIDASIAPIGTSVK